MTPKFLDLLYFRKRYTGICKAALSSSYLSPSVYEVVYVVIPLQKRQVSPVYHLPIPIHSSSSPSLILIMLLPRQRNSPLSDLIPVSTQVNDFMMVLSNSRYLPTVAVISLTHIHVVPFQNPIETRENL